MTEGLTECVCTPLEENCPVAELTHQALQRKQYFLNELYSSTIKAVVPLSLRTLIASCLGQVLCKLPPLND